MATKLEQYQEIQSLVQKEARDIATQVYKELAPQYKVPEVPVHVHNGSDAPFVPFVNVTSVLVYIPVNIQGVQAQTSTNYSTFWIAPDNCNVIAISEVHKVAGTAGGSVTLNVEKLTGITAPGSGTSILSTAFNLKGTANTVQNGTLTNVIATKQLAIGDRLALVVSGTLTTLENVTVMVTLQFNN